MVASAVLELILLEEWGVGRSGQQLFQFGVDLQERNRESSHFHRSRVFADVGMEDSDTFFLEDFINLSVNDNERISQWSNDACF